MNSLQKLTTLGQSPWQDNISRDQLISGALKSTVDNREITGLTSNPTIFQKAISGSSDYDNTIGKLAVLDKNPEDIFFALASEDIKQAADIFMPVYERSNGKDGFVSIEVSPRLAMNTDATIQEAIKLWNDIDMPNLMVKIPATIPGLEAITEVTAHGINVNVTLIFSVQRYEMVINAYMSGLENRINSGNSIDTINSVASFFISRIDTLVDAQLESITSNTVNIDQMKGVTAIANAHLAYELFQNSRVGSRWMDLENKGGNIQRPLWASTSTKNPEYSDVLYVESLIAKHTVNTMPPETILAFKDHGNAILASFSDTKTSKAHMDNLASVGIFIDEISSKLESDGVHSFLDSYEQLLSVIEERSLSLKKDKR